MERSILLTTDADGSELNMFGKKIWKALRLLQAVYDDKIIFGRHYKLGQYIIINMSYAEEYKAAALSTAKVINGLCDSTDSVIFYRLALYRATHIDQFV